MRARCAGLAFLLLGLAAASARGATLTGTVLDPQGKPVEYANVAVPALKRGAVTDEQGRFTLELPAGRLTLEVSQIGYELKRVSVEVAEPAPAAVRVTLHEEPVAISEVQVSASSFGKAGKSEGAVVRRLDIMTTPGGTADVFQALRGLPGIISPNEGAALYVRGGDPREALIRLDGGEIGHPYHYESASGGLFSAFSTYMLKSAYFSSGGFSSKYGGVLSGVLDIESSDPVNARTVSVGANLVGGDLSTSWALVPDKLAFIGGLRRSATDLLIGLYGAPSDYTSFPRSQDGAGKLLWRYSPTGRLALLYLDASDNVGVNADYLNVVQEWRHRARNQLLGVQFKQLVAEKLALGGQVSGQRFHDRWAYGGFGGTRREENAQANLDAVWAAHRRHEVSFGLNWRDNRAAIRAVDAADSTDLATGAPARVVDYDTRVRYPGFYLEDKVRLVDRLYATLGGRLDRASRPGVWTADPRAALAYLIGERQSVRVSAGRFHQLAAPERLDPVYGNPELKPLVADHLIAGYEWKSDNLNVRLETYRKDYRNLVTNDPLTYYANGGSGYARGVDVFVQGSATFGSGWISYGYLDSRRRELDAPRQVPSSYGVRHSLTAVGTKDLGGHLQAGFRLGYATGRPYRPVVGRSYDAGRGVWRPVYGEVNSARLPDYSRLDVRLTRLFSLPAWGGLPASSVCALYLEALNVLDRKNVLEYTYSDDYAERHESLSYFSDRYLVGGFALTW